ncbi:acyl-CoA dehydrogenase family protein [Catelliglobosispora koreensis]|uniref:acyl-CoA dehydrogenase family protein n=1 Tax=Catelliglobosispora koreensis TaxID=129052 RepID=UPI00036A9C0E|nr:acyl-CoA dehydrogenase family protein [Catelliglobosispora koreensis]
MDLTDSPQLATFRQRVRSWLQAHQSDAPTEKTGLHIKDIEPFRAWQRQLAEAGLVGVTWPVEFGGQGLGMIEQAVINSELYRLGLPGALDLIGLGNLGPTIIVHGTAGQKERHLKPLLTGDEIWCQFFSEPSAGSDLAGIRTRAVKTDEGWLLNGQKVWTTNAQHAAFGLLLARTDPSLPKHQGLSMFIVDMKAPGVQVRPLRQLTGMAAFNEVFFDNVELPETAIVGEVNDGWAVALTCLMYERFNLLTMLDQIGWQPSVFVQPLRDKIKPQHVQPLASVLVDLLAVRYSGHRALSKVAHGELPGPEAGLGKITLVDAAIRGAQIIAEVDGPSALDGQWGQVLAEMQGLRSGGGTDEILLNTIGERVLGLPGEPRVDKGMPFSEVMS